MTFRILTVCTGNICRSPLAEQLLRRELSSFLDVSVRSAGTGALVGAGMPEEAQAVALRAGVADAAAHRARQLQAADLAEADLVLAMARDHRRSIVELTPAATRKAFTVRELARIAAEITDEELRDEVDGALSADAALRSVVSLASSFRGIVPPPEAPTDLDVIDPYRQSTEVYELSGAQLVPAAEAVVGLFRRAVALMPAGR